MYFKIFFFGIVILTIFQNVFGKEDETQSQSSLKQSLNSSKLKLMQFRNSMKGTPSPDDPNATPSRTQKVKAKAYEVGSKIKQTSQDKGGKVYQWFSDRYYRFKNRNPKVPPTPNASPATAALTASTVATVPAAPNTATTA